MSTPIKKTLNILMTFPAMTAACVKSRLAPAATFLLAIIALVVFCYESAQTSLPPTEKRYEAAKAGIARLKADQRKGQHREPWEKLAREFKSIYQTDPAWPNRPAALFRCAESLEELAARSCSTADARKAIECYESLAMRHASSRLADDALFRAAKIRAARLKDDKGAIGLLERLRRQYPRGDMIPAAAALEKALRASRDGKTAPEEVRKAALGAQDAGEEHLQGRQRALRARVTPASDGEQVRKLADAKKRLAALRDDSLRACWRQPWEGLRDDFLKIHAMRKKGKAADSALFHAGASQEHLADCSRLASDYRRAAEIYSGLAEDYPKSALADDALLAGARIQASRLGRQEQAKSALRKIGSSYPRGDKAREAAALLASLEDGPAKGARQKQAAEARRELQVLSWDSPGKNSVTIVLEMSAPTRYSATLRPAAGKALPRVVLKLANADVVQDVRRGVRVNGSLLKAVSVEEHGADASLNFDFREVRRFAAHALENPPRIVLNVVAGKSQLPAAPAGDVGHAQGSGTGKSAGASQTASGQTPAATVASRHMGDMASQLGLTVGTVFIDAGHGGRDPGTSHNSIVERQVALDVAQQLGALLAANGLEVKYSRRKDATLRLSERTRLANVGQADIFVSIHINASENNSVNGFETYYLDLASNPRAARVAALENAGSDRRLGDMHRVLADVMLNARIGESRNLAADIQRMTLFRLKKRQFETRSNGVKSAPFHVLIGAQMPAVLVELGYCTNKAEARNLASPKYRHALAEGLAEGILAYRDRLVKRRTAGNPLTSRKGNAI